MGGIWKFLRGKPVSRGMFLSAYGQLGRAWWDLRRRPLREVLSGLGRASADAGIPETNPVQLDTAKAVGHAVRAAASRTPWPGTCLVQVLAAQRMLQARGIGGVVHIGASPGGDAFGKEFAAHAWLVCGDEFVVGEAGHERFETIASFPWRVSASGGDALYSAKD